jgi:hypothetical protein
MIGRPGIGAIAVLFALAAGAANAVGASLFELTSPAFTDGAVLLLK